MKTVSTINTSIKHIPALFNKIEFSENETIINFGCGRYPDMVNDKLKNTIISYDPQFDKKENNKTNVVTDIVDLYKIVDSFNGERDVITLCANVFNVLTDDLLDDVIIQLTALHYIGCKIFISVYEGDKSGVHKKTTKGFQRNEKTNQYLYLLDFGIVSIKRNVISII